MRVKISEVSISGVENGDEHDGNDDLWKDK